MDNNNYGRKESKIGRDGSKTHFMKQIKEDLGKVLLDVT